MGTDLVWMSYGVFYFFHACSHGLMSLAIGRAMGFAEMTRLKFQQYKMKECGRKSDVKRNVA